MRRTTFLLLALVLLLAARLHAQDAMPDTTRTAPLTADSTIGELLSHPALDGFADMTLPWYGRDYDADQRLSEIAGMLPYHSAVDVPTVLDGLNRLIADSAAGLPVFEHLYSAEERAADATLGAAGLFFFAGDPGAPFALIAPGGGFSYVGSVHEGFPYAARISDSGLNAFVLTYRTGGSGRPATQDMARAVDLIRDRAGVYRVSPDGYSVWGSSAGARMAAFIGSDTPAGHGGRTAQPPAAVVMAYTSHTATGESDPPTYVVVGTQDRIAPPRNMAPRVEALRQRGIEVTYAVIPDVGHGFGTGRGTAAEGWIDDAIAFWRRQLGE
ncbi:alpha/beta hydrolase [Antarctobacter sp.]|uniref:alpha/beta hydrolase n=1 Tax=Antarctobacter sp. TaxID=1872577 RepID=UPI003A9113BF